MKLLLSLFLVMLAACAIAVQGTAGQYRIDLHTDPAIVPVGRVKLLLSLTDSAGKPVENATVRVLAQMPGMPMGERVEVAVPANEPGAYSAPAVLGMAGVYGVKVTITGPLGAGETTLSISTGQPTEEEHGIAPTTVFLGLVVVLVVGLTIRQARRTGSKFEWHSIFSGQVAFSILLIGMALAISVWAVNKYRRPGSMTPLEAQTMEMNSPPPEGTLPVNLARVEMRPFSTSVTYTGQAVGLVEQDVIARVSGSIVWMPGYVGDKVTKGQLLAKLDTTQIDPMVAEKTAQSSAASDGVDIAQSDYQRAVAEVAQAHAEQAMKVGEIDEAKAMLTAVEQEHLSAEANLRMEQASVVDARSQVTVAESDRDYWSQELGRSKQLFEKGALSKDELQKAEASSTSAIAKVRQTYAGVEEANARVEAAKAAVNKAKAEVIAGTNKLREAQSEHHVHMAHVTSAQAAADAARKRIKQASAEERMAHAGLQGATTQRGYAELRAEVDGVITSREISPGVVVSPGQSVLKIAQISPIRLQANVPEADLTRIQLGAVVKIRSHEGDQNALSLRVTSISPSVDANSRTGVVEAVYANADRRFRPGQYISMEISTGETSQSLVIPSDSVQTEENGVFAWVAEPSTNNMFTLSRHEIKIGGQSSDWVAVQSGLQAGQQVVIAPPSGLEAGISVTSSNQTGISSQVGKIDQTIVITAAGYNPPSINVPANKAFRVTFIRKDDKACGTEVIFPDLGIHRALPLNQPVVVEIPGQPAGKALNFTCNMNMLKGQAVVR